MLADIKQTIAAYVVLTIIAIIVCIIIYRIIVNSNLYDKLAKHISPVFNSIKDTGVLIVNKLKGSFDRGIGKPMVCAENEDMIAGLCYPKCTDIDGVPTDGSTAICWQKCPDGYRNDGAFCAKPESYGRGVGRIPSATCPDGWKLRGIGSASWCDNNASFIWNLKTQNSNVSCNSDEDMYGGLCYPKCRPGYHAVGCCVCSPDCPSGFGADIGVSCTKKSYTRGVGKPIHTCPPDMDLDAGLCYPKCENTTRGRELISQNPNIRFAGVGPICWMK